MARTRAVLLFVLLGVVGLVAATTPPSLYPGRDIDAGIGRINDLAFSSDGRLVAAGGAGGFGVWDAQTGNQIRKDAAANIQKLVFGAQGTLLALGGSDGRVAVVDLRSGMAREAARHNKAVTALAFSADGHTGASGDAEGNITLWDPDRGAIGPLKDSGQKKDIFVLAFTGSNTLLSASKDLQIVTWDVAGKRALRRGTLQSAVRGRVVVPNAGAVDPTGDKLLVGAQLVAEQRGGALTGAGLARPSDLKRDNILMPYTVSTGFSGDAVNTTDYLAEHVALGPGACFAFFSSNYRDQPRLHVWGLAQEGDDLARIDVMGRIAAVAVEAAGHAVAVATDAGRIRTWTVSGATPADCDAYMKKPSSVQVDAKISTGSETSPLIKGGAGTRVAVLRFDATGIDAGLGDAVAEMVAGELANSPQVTVIERSAIDKVLKEMEIQRSGLTTSDAVKIGKGLNAKTVIFGGVRRFGDSTFVVTARAVDVETQQVQGSREVTCENCKEADLPRAVTALRRIIVP